jgi:hypothetical protein
MFSRIVSLSLCCSLLFPVGAWAERRPEEQKKSSAVPGGAPSAQLLSEEEEAELEERAEEAGPEVAGGALSNLHLTYAVIALAAIVLVLVVK